MRRRDFIAAFGGAAAWPLVARAQQNRKRSVIGVLWHAGNEQEEANYLAALRKGLTDLGYVEGQDIVLANRFAAENYDRFKGMAKELVDLNVDVIVSVTPPATLAAQRATSTIPIVFIIEPDPVARKLVHSLAHPGGHITGLTALIGDQSAKRLELLKDAIPNLSRAAFIVNATAPTAVSNIETARAAASTLAIEVQPIEVRTPADLDEAFSKIAEGNFGGVSLASDSMLFNERKHIAELALRSKLPYVSNLREFVEVGGLMSYGTSFRAAFYRAATYIDKIIKGEKPADIPVEQPTRFELVINLKTAKAIGITIPPQLLARADEVIE